MFFSSPLFFSRFGVFQVEYHVETFCDKNKDELPKESDELFASSPNPFVTNLFAPAGGEPVQTIGKGCMLACLLYTSPSPRD